MAITSNAEEEHMVHFSLMFQICFSKDLMSNFCSTVLLLSLEPACSSAIILSVWSFSLFRMTLSSALLGWLMRLIVR